VLAEFSPLWCFIAEIPSAPFMTGGTREGVCAPRLGWRGKLQCCAFVSASASLAYRAQSYSITDTVETTLVNF